MEAGFAERNKFVTLFGFALAVAFVPGWYGAATTPRWALIATVVPLLLLFSQPRRFTAAHAWGVGLLVWAALSLLWSANVYDGLHQLFEYLFLAGVFVLGVRTESLNPVMNGMVLGIAVSSVVVVLQWWGWREIVWPHGFAPAGLFIDENYLAEAAALCLVAVIAERQWHLIPILAPSIVLTNSRSAFAGLIGAAAVWAWQWLRSPIARFWMVCLIPVLFAFMVLAINKPGTINQRLDIWLDTASHITFFGRGLGSFSTLYADFASKIDILAERPENAHNDFIEVAFEIGIVGWVIVVGFGCAALSGMVEKPALDGRRRGSATARTLAIAFLVMCFVDQASHLPVTAFIGALALGHAVRDGHSLRDALAACRVSLWDWLWFARGNAYGGYRPPG